MKRGAPVTPRKLAFAVLSASALSVASACTFIVKFDDADSGASDTGETDAGQLPVGRDVVQPPIDSGPAPDSGPPVDPVCNGKADGTRYDTNDPAARCCGGQRTRIDSKSNCGICGFVCVDNQTCVQKSGFYYCEGCAWDGNRDDTRCAQSTGCCSTSYDSMGLCAASTCKAGSASCNDPFCVSHGAHCETPSASSYVCSYP